MSNFLLISMYTLGTPYEIEVCELIGSLSVFPQIDYKIYPMNNTGSWEKNCQLKAKVILQSLNEQNKDVVWVDSDAIVKSYPYFFEKLDCDLSLYYLRTTYNDSEMLSGTLFIKNNDKAKNVVKEWIKLNSENNKWDQKNLQYIVENTKDLKIAPLPPEYIHINMFHHHQKDVLKTPVITHYQASRRFRRIINDRTNKNPRVC